MKYIDEFRDAQAAQQLITRIQGAVKADKSYRIMEFCGGHTHTLFRYGIPELLPKNVQLLHGPGCPVCVLPIPRIDAAIEIALKPKVILCSYGDMLRVPGSNGMSLLKARAQGADVRMVYSPVEVLQVAQDQPEHEVVFFAVGFETTTPPTAQLLALAEAAKIPNLSIFCNHVLTPPAMLSVLEDDMVVDGMIAPGHVSLVTGSQAFTEVVNDYHLPLVVTGFEPLDLLQAIYMLVLQINQGEQQLENQYTRAVTTQGNTKAQALIQHYLEPRDSFEWRGLGQLANSALKIRDAYGAFDAEKRFRLSKQSASDNKACECPAVLRGQKKPNECKLFNKPCTPDNPLGACMVSSEGACAAYYNYQPLTLSEPAAEALNETFIETKPCH